MKKIACFLAVVACVACNYDVSDVSGEDQAGKSSGELSVTLDYETVMSKAADDYLTTLSVENRVNRVDVLVFDKQTGNLNASKVLGAVGDPCVFSITTGDKIVYAMANAPDLTRVLHISQLDEIVDDLSLSDYRSAGFVMVGREECQVRLGEVSEPTVALKRMVSRVVLKKMKNKIASQYGKITVDCIFLANANKIHTLGGLAKVPVNVDGYADEAKTMPIGKNGVTGDCPLYMYRELGVSIPEGGTKTDVHYMYCYPTSSESKTCIYVLLTISGNQYYYRVPLPNGLEANKTYGVELEFINLGAATPPEGDLQKGQINAVVSVSGWDAGESYTVEF